MITFVSIASLYEKYHASRDDERLGLFKTVRAEFGVERGLYPGCFVHITPSFVIQDMSYVDSDRNAKRFFEIGMPEELVRNRCGNDVMPGINFYFQDYRDPIPIEDESVDLLISQYAGFVSEACKRYLARDGYLLVNNSHGDAGLATCDEEFQLVAVVDRRGDRWTLKTGDLSMYFEPKSNSVPQDASVLANHIRELGRGIAYTRTAADYVFQRI